MNPIRGISYYIDQQKRMFFNVGTKIYGGQIEISEIIEDIDKVNNNHYIYIFISNLQSREKFLWKKVINGNQIVEYDCSIIFNENEAS